MSNTNEKSVFTVTRIIDAPRKLVFKVWTEPQHLEKWWGPKDFIITTYKMDLRVGGEYVFGMKMPDGGEMWAKLVFREIIEPEKFSFVVSFTDNKGNVIRQPYDPSWPLEVLNTVYFTEEGSKTKIVLKAVPVNATAGEHDVFKAEHPNMNKGYNGNIDKLETYVNQLK